MTKAAAATIPDMMHGGQADRLASISRQLAEPRQAIEQTFLDMGERLLGCTTLLNEVAAAHEGMPAELEGADFRAAAELLETIHSQVGTLAAAHSGEQGHLGALSDMAIGISTPLANLSRTVRTIRLLTVNARIVAAGIGGRQGDFSAFTDDMTTLGNSVQEAVAAFAGAYDGFTSSLSRARAADVAFMVRHGGTMGDISSRLTEHLARVADHRARARSKASEHTQLTGQIRTRIGMAVAALQTGDIVRQRVEHVEQALDLLGAYLEDATGDVVRRSHTVCAVCHLQTAQIDEAVEEFDRQIADLALSLRQLAGDAAAVLRAGNAEAEALLSHGGDALNGMIDDLGEVRALLADFAQTRAGMEQTASNVARTVATMVGHLDAIADIEHRIHLLSLNTTIQCSRLGDDGRALRVVAQDLRDLATETVEAAGAIMDGLRQVDNLARGLVEGQSGGLADDILALGRDAARATDLLQTVVRRLHDRVATIGASGPRTVRQLEQTAASVSNRRDFVESWRQARRDILGMSPLGSQAFDAASVEEELVARMRARYTMDGERRVHDAMLGAPAAAAMQAVPATAGEAGLDDVLF